MLIAFYFIEGHKIVKERGVDALIVFGNNFRVLLEVAKVKDLVESLACIIILNDQ